MRQETESNSCAATSGITKFWQASHRFPSSPVVEPAHTRAPLPVEEHLDEPGGARARGQDRLDGGRGEKREPRPNVRAHSRYDYYFGRSPGTSRKYSSISEPPSGLTITRTERLMLPNCTIDG